MSEEQYYLEQKPNTLSWRKTPRNTVYQLQEREMKFEGGEKILNIGWKDRVTIKKVLGRADEGVRSFR